MQDPGICSLAKEIPNLFQSHERDSVLHLKYALNQAGEKSAFTTKHKTELWA